MTENRNWKHWKEVIKILENKYCNSEQLEEWTSLKFLEVVFDSEVEDRKIDTIVLNERISRRKQLVFWLNNKYERYLYILWIGKLLRK